MQGMIITDSTIVRNLEAASAGSGVGLDMLMENAGAKVADLAAKLINEIHPETVIPTHYGSFVGGRDAGRQCKELIGEGIKVELLLDEN